MKRQCFIYLLILAACGPPPSQENANPENLIGTWQRIKYVNPEISDTSWVDQNPKILFLKHLTPTHFTWLSFNTETEKLNGTAGGTYTYDGITYTENIEYYYPTGSSIQGKTIPFTVHFMDGNWHHVGRFQETELDPEINEMVRGDTVLIEEMWTKISSVENQNAELVGTWQLVSFKNRRDSTRLQFPKFLTYYKLITPTHFIWVQVNNDDNEVYAEGGGAYTLNGNTYTEHLSYHHPKEEALRGLVVPFHYEMVNDQWIHTGILVRPVFDTDGNRTGVDTSYIDEVWTRWKPDEDLN